MKRVCNPRLGLARSPRRLRLASVGFVFVYCTALASPGHAQHLDVSLNTMRQVGRQCEFGLVLANRIDSRLAGVRGRATLRDAQGTSIGSQDFVAAFQDGRPASSQLMIPAECNRVARMHVRVNSIHTDGSWTSASPQLGFANRGVRASRVATVRME